MREQQRELMHEYLEQTQEAWKESEERAEDTLFKIIKSEKRTPFVILDGILVLLLIGLMIFAIVDGKHINRVTIETCEGVPADCHGDQEICNAIINATKERVRTVNPFFQLTKINNTGSET